MFDVAIIGAGPAGTAAAFDLLRKGLKVLILDKYEFPRKKACAGGITPKGYHLFKYDISSVVKRKCRTVRINPVNKKLFSITDKNTLCYMTKREELDLFSLNKVIKQGGDFRVIKKIQSIEETPSFVTIHTNGESFKASYLIGADGANSVVRRFVSPGFCQNQVAIEADIKIDRPDRVKMEFDFSRLPRTYYWIFPKDDHVNIGIYSVDPGLRLKAQLLYDYAKEKFSSNRLEAIKGYPVCTGGFNYRLNSKRILLAGDAAGLSERLFGEGIFFAVKSGQKAAKAILKSERHGLPVGRLYQEQLKTIQSDLRWYDLSSRWFYRFPGISLRLASSSFIHKPVARGYADGKTITQILYGKFAE